MKITRTFTAGIMNKDLDERLIPQGQYRDGQNIGVSTSEESNVGSIENILGNNQVGGDLSFLSASAATIGAIADGANEEFYWFVTDTNFDYILRYNETSNSHVVLLKDTKGRVLKFDKEYTITGINIIGNLLFWTDNLNPPRRLNIDRYYGFDAFTEDDISVIVKPPLNAPVIELQNTSGNLLPQSLTNEENYLAEKYIRFGYRWRYENNEYSSLSPFSSTSFGTTNFSFDYSQGVFTSMINGFNQVKVTFETGQEQVDDIQLVFFNEYTGAVYVIETFNKKNNLWLSNTSVDVLFNNSKIYSILSADEVSRLFDNVPRKAKAQEIIGSRLIYGNYIQGYDLVDSNDNEVNMDFSLDHQSVSTATLKGLPSFHSDRDYEVGIVYLDDYGRMSTVLTPATSSSQFTNTTYIPPSHSNDINDLRVSIYNKAPAWASKYRIYLKQSKENNYSTIFPLASYRDGSDFYFFIIRSEVTKLEEGAYIYMKQINGVATNSNQEYKILEIETKERDFLGNDEIAGTYFKISDSNSTIILDEYEGQWEAEGIGGYPATGNSLGSSFPATTSSPNFGGHIIEDLNFTGLNGSAEAVAQIDFPHFYGSSTTNTTLQLVKGSKDSENSTSALRDARIRVTITPNETFKVESFEDGIYVVWYENVSLAAHYFSNYSINNPPPGVTSNNNSLYDLDILIRFSDGPGYSENDYFIINVHSKFGVNLFGVTTENTGVGPNTSSSITSPNALAGVSPVSGGKSSSGEIIYSLPSSNLNPVPNYRDKPINIGAIIQMNLTEKYWLGNSVVGTRESKNQFISSAKYNNIEEFFYEEEIWQTLRHINAQDGSNNRGFRVFFRRVYSDVNYAGARSFSVSGEDVAQYQFSQALSNGPQGAPYLNGQGQWNDYAMLLSYTQPILMFIKASSIQEQTNNWSFNSVNSDLKITEIECEFKIIQNEFSPPVFETKPIENSSDVFYETPFTFNINQPAGLHEGNIQDQLPFTKSAIVSLNTNTLASPTLAQQQNVEFNCFSFGNGIEATRIKSDDVLPWLKYSPRASSSIEKYEEEHLSASLTYSGVFVQNTNLNNLNEFNLSLANYKDVNKEYGPIQKLHTRDNDIITLQEDKISKILFGKNLLSDSVGGGSITAIPEVLGTQIPYVGEYGISHNPESFAQWGNSLYFTDAKRGAVIRLGGDGLFEINNLGMSDYFKDLFRDNFLKQKLGVYDPFKEQYVVSNTDQDAIPCESNVKGLFKSNPIFSFGSSTVFLEIESTRSWSVTLNDTGDGTSWVTVNGNTPTYNGSNDETVSITVAAQPVSSPRRSLTLTVTTCDGIVFNETITQNGTLPVEIEVWGIGKGQTGSVLTGDVTYDYSSNTVGALAYLNQELKTDNELFVQRILNGQEGEVGIPYEGDTVTVEASEAGAAGKEIFSDLLGGKMYYLATNTKYNQSQVSDLLADPGLNTFTPILGGTTWSGNFIFNRVGFEYFYIIVDYTNEIQASAAAQFDFPAAANNVPGTFRGKINFGNNEGRVSLAYTPTSGGGALGNIFTIKQGDTVIATSGPTPTTVAGTLDFLKTGNTNVYDVEIQHYGDNQTFRLTAPLPTLTAFDWRSTQESIDPSDPLYVCRVAPPPVNTTRYHNGAAALPVEGDIVYENPLGLSRLSSGWHRYGTAVAPNATYLFIDDSSVVTQIDQCAACAEVAPPVINTPVSLNLIEKQDFYLQIEATNNPTDYVINGTCSQINITAGADGATISWNDCDSIARNASIRPNSTLAILTTGGYTTTSGSTTSTTTGVLAELFLPEGMSFDLKKGIISGAPRASGTFVIEFVARNCFGASPVFTLTLSVADVGQKTFEMDGEQFAYSSALGCGLTPTATLFYHNGTGDDPKVNDEVSVPSVGKGGTGQREVFKGGYVWYKAPNIGPNGSALLIDDKGIIVDIFTCP